MGQLHRTRVRLYGLAVIAVLAAACTSAPEATGSLPSSSHYHALAAGSSLVMATHERVYSSPDGRSWSAVDHAVGHPLAVGIGPGTVIGGERGLERKRYDEPLRHEGVTVVAVDGDDIWAWVRGAGLVRRRGQAEVQHYLQTDPGPDDGIAALTVGDGQLVAVGPNFGAFRSDDGAATWTDLAAPVAPTAAALLDGVIYIGSIDGVWRLGRTWERVDLDTAGQVASLASVGPSLWVLAQGGELYRSGDGAATWTLIARA